MTKRFLIPALAMLLTLTLASCEKNNKMFHFDYDGPCHCGVDNPLEDLEWLHNNALQFESMRDKQWATISICTFDSTRQGFLINSCLNCSDAGVGFYDCEGNYIGMVYGIDGIPLETYNIDPASVREIYRNFPDTSATFVGKRWQLLRFFDRETQTSEAPMRGDEAIPFWIQFNADGTVEAGGINHLNGNYFIYESDHIIINIHSSTEIYDQTGWEDRLIEALNDATICYIDYYGRTIRIYYDMNRKYIEFVRSVI